MATQAFKVQRGTSIILAGNATLTITAGTEYTAPSVITKAFIRITNCRLSGMGKTVGGANQNSDDFSVRIANPGNLLTSINFEHSGTANDCRVDWEIIEYVGSAAGTNEMKVLDQGIVTGTAAQLDGSTVAPTTDADVVVFITGQATNNTGKTDAHYHLWASSWVAASNTPRFDRDSTATNSTAWVSYAVVEFTGSNWKVTREDFTATGSVWATNDNVSWTHTLGTSVSDIAKTFMHVQYSTSNDGTGLEDAGDAVSLDSTTLLRVWNKVTTGTRRKVCWIVENSQADGTARNLTVEHVTIRDDTTSGAEERSWTQTVTTVDDTAETSIMGESASVDGVATNLPRGWINIRLTATTTVTHTESDTLQERRFAYEVVQWPEDPAAPADDGAMAASGSSTVSWVGAALFAGVLAASGAATTLFTGEAEANADLAASGVATTAWTGQSAFEAVLAASGVATTNFTGESLFDGVLSASGVATTLFTGESLFDGVLSASGVATTTWTGESLFDGVFASSGVATVAWVSQTGSVWSGSGVATVTWTGESLFDGALAASGAATTLFTGASLFDGVFSMSGLATIDFVSATGAAEGVLAASGQATAQFVGAPLFEAVFASSGAAVTAFIGVASVDPLPPAGNIQQYLHLDVPIVNVEFGTPTPEFLLHDQLIQDLAAAGADSITELLTPTGVVPGTYGSSTLISTFEVGADGRLIVAGEVAFSSGGDSFTWPPEIDNAYSGSSNAFKGNLIQPLVNMTITGIVAYIQTTSGHTYRAGVYRIDGSDNIDEITAESATQTPATELNGIPLVFDLTANLIAGNDYFVGVGRTDGGDTFVLPLSIESLTAVESLYYAAMPTRIYSRSSVLPDAIIEIPQQAPVLTDATTVAASQTCFGIGIRFSI